MREGSLPPAGSGTTHPVVEEEEPLLGPAEPNYPLFMPEEQVDEDEPWTPQQVRHCWARWHKYLDKAEVSALWEKGHETEQDRYRTILEMLEADDRRLKKEGLEVSQQREKWTMMQRNCRVRASLAPYRDELQSISDAADTVLRHQTRMLHMNLHQGKWLDDTSKNPGRLCSLKRVRIGSFDDADSWEVQVATGLSNSRYYLGHTGGDYVFEYRGSGHAGCDKCCLGGNAWDPNDPIWSHPGLHGPFGLGQGDAETASFRFQGLVPRTWKEYSARFEHVCKEVLQVLATIISFEPEGDGPLWDAQCQHVSTFSKINNWVLTHVRYAWEVRVSLNHPYLCWAQSILHHHPRICEFAYLVARLDERLDRGLARQAMAPLIDTVESATGMTLEELCVIYENILAREAARELYESRNVEHCVIYDNEDHEIEEIHAFYAQPKFQVDPVHPSNRFNRPHVNEALDTAVELCCHNWSWTNRAASAILFELRTQFCLPISSDNIATAVLQRVRPQPQQLGSGQTDPISGQASHEDTSTIEVKTQPETASTSSETRGKKRTAAELQPSPESGHQKDKDESNDGITPRKYRGRPRHQPGT